MLPVKVIQVFFLVALVGSLFMSLGCVAPPKGDTKVIPMETSASPVSTVKPNESTTASGTPTLVPFVTIETPTAVPGTISPVNETAAPTPVPGDTYVTVFNSSQVFRYNSTVLSMDLVNPPLVIDFNVTPVMVTDKKWYRNKTLSHDEVNATLIVPSPNAWFKATVSDKNTGDVVLEDGYLKEYSSETTKQMKVMKAGLFRVDFSGNDVTVAINMSVKKEGNIVTAENST